jgi:glutaredoxin 3
VECKFKKNGGIKMSVIVYSTTTCPWCVRVKNYLKDNNVDFKEINVGLDRNAAMEMMRKSGQMGVPVVDINGSIVVGFDKATIDKLLGLK